MMERIDVIRERDNMYVDTMQEYYNSFGIEMIGPYQEWRKLSYEEAMALQELKAGGPSSTDCGSSGGGGRYCRHVQWRQ